MPVGPVKMVHSSEKLGGEKVENFVMSVIEAASSGGSSAASGSSGRVSHYPISPSRKTTRSQSSQELVEDTLGSLTTLLSVSSSTLIQSTEKIVSTKVTGGKLQNKRKETQPRKIILRRKKSSLKTLSPEDLGDVTSNPQGASPPALLVTLPSSSQSSTPVDKYFNGIAGSGHKSPISAAASPSSNDHPSTFHLRKPISSYRNNSNNSNYNNHKSNSEIKNTSPNVSRRTSTSVGGQFKDIDKKVEGQRSPNYTAAAAADSKGNLEPLELHNNSNNTSSVGGRNAQDVVLHSSINKSNNTDDDDNEKNERRQQELNNHTDDDNVGDSCHGRICVHHYHHHSHHHHYHYYDNNSLPSHRQTHPSLSTDNENQHEDNQPQQQNNITNDRLNPQQPHLHYHNDHTMIKNTTKHSPPPAEQTPVSPPPSHDHPDDISFYRKFSAISPVYNKRRSKSSLEWTGADSTLLNGAKGNGGVCSKQKRQKSRSTPMKLELVGTSNITSGADGGADYQYGCKCGGCHFCCNELSCDCCCDECCCARQFSHLTTLVDNDEPNLDQRRHTTSSLGKNTSILKRISRSVESLNIGNDGHVIIHDHEEGSDDDDDDDDDLFNDPDSFIDAHLLRHLEMFDSDPDDILNNIEDDKNMDTKYRGTNDPGQMHRVSIKEENAVTTEHKRAVCTAAPDDDDDNGDCKDRTSSVGNIHDRDGNSAAAAITTDNGTTPMKSNGNIVIVKRRPTRSSTDYQINVGDGSDRRTSSSTGEHHHHHRRKRSTRNVLRTANGEIRSSPITPMHLSENSNETSGARTGGVVVVEEQTRRSAMMTVTVDTMSLFLDAIHLQMNQG